MKNTKLSLLAIVASTVVSITAYNDDRPRPVRTVVEGTTDTAGRAVEGAGEFTGDVLGGIGSIFTGKSREEREQEKEDRRQERERRRQERNARRNQ